MADASSINFMEPDGKIWNVGNGGELNIKSGGTLDVEAGATLNLAGRISRTTTVELYDDFLGDVLDDAWSGAKGTDAQAVVPTLVAGEEDGVVRLTAGDTVTVAESISILTHGLNWKAESGNLVGEFRIRMASIANVAVFVGFTDVLATTTLEEPFSLSGTTFTSNATDAVGLLFDTAATTDVWNIIGVADGTDTAATAITAPVADTWETFKIVLSAAGTATVYRNGTLKATIAEAVTPSVALTPVVSVMARTTTTKTVDVDYVHVAKTRNS